MRSADIFFLRVIVSYTLHTKFSEKLVSWQMQMSAEIYDIWPTLRHVHDMSTTFPTKFFWNLSRPLMVMKLENCLKMLLSLELNQAKQQHFSIILSKTNWPPAILQWHLQSTTITRYWKISGLKISVLNRGSFTPENFSVTLHIHSSLMVRLLRVKVES